VSWRSSPVKEPNDSATAAASSPSGSPPRTRHGVCRDAVPRASRSSGARERSSRTQAPGACTSIRDRARGPRVERSNPGHDHPTHPFAGR
jgi:hypothetical protein